MLNIKSDKLILVIIIMLGALLRIYKFPEFPAFTDEVREALIAYDMYSFSKFHLTSFSTYIGPIHAYFITIIMWFFGPSIWLPRVIGLIFNIALIYVVYIFGKNWSNSKVGLITAFCVSLNPILILINSRVGWATCIAPFFSVLLLIVFKQFKDNNSVKVSIKIGIISAILLNLHPLMLFYIIPVLVNCLISLNQHKSYKIKFKYLLSISIPFTIIMVPMILANIIIPNNSVNVALDQGNLSAEKLEFDADDYTRDLDRMSAQMEHVINKAVIFEGQLFPEYSYKPIYQVDSIYTISFILFLIGVLLILYQRNFNNLLIVTIIFSMMVLSPLINTNYFEGLTVRYFSVLIPLADFIIVGLLYKLYKLSKHKLWHVIIVTFSISFIVYVPLSNLYQFYLSRDDLNYSITNDIEYLKINSDLGYNIYYYNDNDKDFESEYSIVEYILKFGKVNNTFRIEKDYNINQNNLLLMPKKILLNDDIENPKIIEDGLVEHIYSGDEFYVFR